jgi:hypothetical protein
MPAKKDIADLSPQTFFDKRRRGLMPWSKLFAESVQNLKNPAIPVSAKLAWVLMQPIMSRSDEPGFLLENGKPIELADLAVELWIDAEQLKQDIETLLRFRWLRRDERGFIFDPFMEKDSKASPQKWGDVRPTVEKSREEERRGDNSLLLLDDTHTPTKDAPAAAPAPANAVATQALWKNKASEFQPKFPSLDCSVQIDRWLKREKKEGREPEPTDEKAIKRLTGWLEFAEKKIKSGEWADKKHSSEKQSAKPDSAKLAKKKAATSKPKAKKAEVESAALEESEPDIIDDFLYHDWISHDDLVKEVAKKYGMSKHEAEDSVMSARRQGYVITTIDAQELFAAKCHSYDELIGCETYHELLEAQEEGAANKKAKLIESSVAPEDSEPSAETRDLVSNRRHGSREDFFFALGERWDVFNRCINEGLIKSLPNGLYVGSEFLKSYQRDEKAYAEKSAKFKAMREERERKEAEDKAEAERIAAEQKAERERLAEAAEAKRLAAEKRKTEREADPAWQAREAQRQANIKRINAWAATVRIVPQEDLTAEPTEEDLTAA